MVLIGVTNRKCNLKVMLMLQCYRCKEKKIVIENKVYVMMSHL